MIRDIGHGACCDHCAATGGSCATKPKLGWAVSRIPRYRRLGTLTCDQDGNCYDSATGTYSTPQSGGLTLAQVQAAAGAGECAYGTDASGNCLPGTMPLPARSAASPFSSFSSFSTWLTQNSAAIVAAGALVGIFAVVGGKRSR